MSGKYSVFVPLVWPIKTAGKKNVSPGYTVTLYILTDFLQLESVQQYGIRASVPKQKQTPTGSEDITETSK